MAERSAEQSPALSPRSAPSDVLPAAFDGGVRFPSDLPTIPSELIRLAGRVVFVDSQTLILADALASVRVQGLSAFEVGEGDWVLVSGRVAGLELLDAELLWRQPAPAPRGAGEFSRLVFHGVGRYLQARARAISETRQYFQEHGFLEVETPFRVPAPGVDLHVQAYAAEAGYLITSPELEMKRLVVAGIPRQFQFARVSRADEAGNLHEAEFTLLEWYRSCASYRAVLEDTEAIVRRVAHSVGNNARLTTPSGRSLQVDSPFARITLAAAFQRYAGVQDVATLAEQDESRYFELLVERVEPALADYDVPVFLLEYPISQAALARPCPHDPRFAERFELYAGGVELCNGYGELTCPAEQRRRFQAEQARRRASGETVYPINDWFLDALEEGMPPTGGNALGFDRLLMLALGAPRIQDVMAFPRARL